MASKIPESALFYQDEIRRAHQETAQAMEDIRRATFAFESACNHAQNMKVRMMRALIDAGVKPKTALRIVYEVE